MLKAAAIKIFSPLPGKIKNSIFHFSFNIARPEFVKFAHLYAHAPNMELGLRSLADRGLCPSTIIDVGAFEGKWSEMARRVWPESKAILVEPNTTKINQISKAATLLDATLHQELLGATDGAEVTFHVMESGSSIMAERSPVARHQETRILHRLDSIVPSVVGPALLKIDAQGYELEILKGAQGILDEIDAVLLEVAIIEINVGAPLIADVTAFMKTLGFFVCEVLEIHRRPLDQALNQIDLLFVRENSILFSDKRHFG